MGELCRCLGLAAREHIALVGGGGKTSLMFALAAELVELGRRVVISTTTKIAVRETGGASRVLFFGAGPPPRREIEQAVGRGGDILIAERELPSGKVKGIPPALADEIYRDWAVDCLIVEADGAGQRPLKAPAAHEPVIPRSATTVIAVVGLEGLGAPLGPAMVFRPEIFGRLSGKKTGEPVDASALAAVLASPEGVFKGSPGSARRVALLNKADLLMDREAMEDLVGRILAGPDRCVERAVIGSIKTNQYEMRSG